MLLIVSVFAGGEFPNFSITTENSLCDTKELSLLVDNMQLFFVESI